MAGYRPLFRQSVMRCFRLIKFKLEELDTLPLKNIIKKNDHDFSDDIKSASAVSELKIELLNEWTQKITEIFNEWLLKWLLKNEPPGVTITMVLSMFSATKKQYRRMSEIIQRATEHREERERIELNQIRSLSTNETAFDQNYTRHCIECGAGISVEIISVLNCGHVFHIPCIRTLQQDKDPSLCPLCETQISLFILRGGDSDGIHKFEVEDSEEIEENQIRSVFNETAYNQNYTTHCIVCETEFPQEVISVLNCGHVFHISCFREQQQDRNPSLCPLCETPISFFQLRGSDIDDIYEYEFSTGAGN